MKLLFKIGMSVLLYGIGFFVSLWVVVMLIFTSMFYLDDKVMNKSLECSVQEVYTNVDKTGMIKVSDWCLKPSVEEKTLALVKKPFLYYGISAVLVLLITTPVIYLGLWRRPKNRAKLAKV